MCDRDASAPTAQVADAPRGVGGQYGPRQAEPESDLFSVRFQVLLQLIESQFDRPPECGSIGKTLDLIVNSMYPLQTITGNVNRTTRIALWGAIFVSHATTTNRNTSPPVLVSSVVATTVINGIQSQTHIISYESPQTEPIVPQRGTAACTTRRAGSPRVPWLLEYLRTVTSRRRCWFPVAQTSASAVLGP